MSHMTMCFQLRVQAYDSAFPTQVAETDVTIFVVRNDNPPIFQNEPYTAVLDEDFPIGQNMENVLATDADGVSAAHRVVGLVGRGDVSGLSGNQTMVTGGTYTTP